MSVPTFLSSLLASNFPAAIWSCLWPAMRTMSARDSISSLLPAKENLQFDFLTDEILGKDVKQLTDQLTNAFYADEYEYCVVKSQWLLDFVWEQLNTGNWKDVNVSWRYLYSFASLLNAMSKAKQSDYNVQDIVRTCDMGLLMGAPILNNILAKIAAALTEDSSLKEKSQEKFTDVVCVKCPNISIECSITRKLCPSLETFRICHMQMELPIIITDAVNYWPAFTSRKWRQNNNRHYYNTHINGQNNLDFIY